MPLVKPNVQAIVQLSGDQIAINALGTNGSSWGSSESEPTKYNATECLAAGIDLCLSANDYLLANGTNPLTDNWNAGSHTIACSAITVTDAHITNYITPITLSNTDSILSMLSVYNFDSGFHRQLSIDLVAGDTRYWMSVFPSAYSNGFINYSGQDEGFAIKRLSDSPIGYDGFDFFIDKNSHVGIMGKLLQGFFIDAQFQIFNTNASTPAFIISGANGQSADYFDIYNHNNSKIMSLNSARTLSVSGMIDVFTDVLPNAGIDMYDCDGNVNSSWRILTSGNHTMEIGTIENIAMQLITNNTSAIHISNLGKVYIGGSFASEMLEINGNVKATNAILTDLSGLLTANASTHLLSGSTGTQNSLVKWNANNLVQNSLWQDSGTYVSVNANTKILQKLLIGGNALDTPSVMLHISGSTDEKFRIQDNRNGIVYPANYMSFNNYAGIVNGKLGYLTSGGTNATLSIVNGYDTSHGGDILIQCMNTGQDIIFNTNAGSMMKWTNNAELQVPGTCNITTSLKIGGAVADTPAAKIHATLLSDSAIAPIMILTNSGTATSNNGVEIDFCAGGDTIVSGIRGYRTDSAYFGGAVELFVQSASAQEFKTGIKVNSDGDVIIPRLAGSGSRTVKVDANGLLSAPP